MSDALDKLKTILETLDLDEATHLAVFDAVAEIEQDFEDDVSKRMIFFSQLAFEIRKSFTLAFGYANLLMDMASNQLPSEQMSSLDEMLRSTQINSRFMEDFLLWKRMETRKFDPTLIEKDIPLWFNELTANADGINIELTTAYSGGEKTISYSYLQSRELIWYLIARSPYHFDEKRRLVSLILTQNRVENSQLARFEIIEKHVSSDELEVIPPFFDRLQNNAIHIYEFLGNPELSIAMAYRLCELVGGTLNYEIVNTDEVRFIVELPLSENL